jgi:hypothetical protein
MYIYTYITLDSFFIQGPFNYNYSYILTTNYNLFEDFKDTLKAIEFKDDLKVYTYEQLKKKFKDDLKVYTYEQLKKKYKNILEQINYIIFIRDILNIYIKKIDEELKEKREAYKDEWTNRADYNNGDPENILEFTIDDFNNLHRNHFLIDSLGTYFYKLKREYPEYSEYTEYSKIGTILETIEGHVNSTLGQKYKVPQGENMIINFSYYIKSLSLDMEQFKEKETEITDFINQNNFIEELEEKKNIEEIELSKRKVLGFAEIIFNAVVIIIGSLIYIFIFLYVFNFVLCFTL